ncbi:winged helix-turn-helix transcriptional regulator [Xanthomonas oryzae]
MVLRTQHPSIPPRVDYEIAPRGSELLHRLELLMTWICTDAK